VQQRHRLNALSKKIPALAAKLFQIVSPCDGDGLRNELSRSISKMRSMERNIFQDYYANFIPYLNAEFGCRQTGSPVAIDCERGQGAE